MIDSFKRIAIRLTFIRYLLAVFLALFVVLTLWCFVEFSRNQQKTVELFVPSIVGVMWSALVFAFYVVFRRVPDDSDKIIVKTTRACFRLLVLVFVSLSGAVIFETFSLIVNVR